MVGSVMVLIRESGGVSGFVHTMQTRLALVQSKRSALLLVYLVGIAIFIESSITSLIAGSVGRPLSDTYGISRAKLAYVCDSTSAPVCSIILFNGWGALLLGLIASEIAAETIQGESISWLLMAIPYNFYAFIALAVTFIVIWFNIDVGPMKESYAVASVPEKEETGNIWFMLVPIVVMVGAVFFFLWWTGDGNMLKGSGSTSIFYALILTLFVALIQYRIYDVMSVKAWALHTLTGMQSMLGIAAILLFAFAIGSVTQQLQTGQYLASYAQYVLSPVYLGAVIFMIASVMAFATGTSWGTFSIMIPIAVPLAVGIDANVAIVIGAVISGGVFGDHCSPISDTTIISSMAAGCDHIEHVKTQLPYALFSGTLALVLFIVAGVLTA
ncbi:MAG: sodium:proton antiporter [Epsilonproteobacteria bacterium]|nr:MAG: sodium:proton antiporter [Campylobacterota bacterium]